MAVAWAPVKTILKLTAGLQAQGLSTWQKTYTVNDEPRTIIVGFRKSKTPVVHKFEAVEHFEIEHLTGKVFRNLYDDVADYLPGNQA